MGAIAPINVWEIPHRGGRGADRSTKLLKLRERGRIVEKALENQVIGYKTRYRILQVRCKTILNTISLNINNCEQVKIRSCLYLPSRLHFS